MVRPAEVRITSVHFPGELRVVDEELEQAFPVVFKKRALQRCYSFGFALVNLLQFTRRIEKEIPIVIVKLFGHIERGAMTRGAELGYGTEGFCVIFFSTHRKGEHC